MKRFPTKRFLTWLKGLPARRKIEMGDCKACLLAMAGRQVMGGIDVSASADYTAIFIDRKDVLVPNNIHTLLPDTFNPSSTFTVAQLRRPFRKAGLL